MPDGLDIVAAKLFVRPGDTVLDIGARHGESSALYLARGAAVIHAFEPLASNFDLMPATLRADSRFHLHPVALSDRDGVQELIVPRHNDGAGSLHRHYFERLRRDPEDPGCVHSVEVRRLDGLDLPRANFWKIDAEGAELEILRGAAGTLASSAPDIVQVEIFFHDIARYRDTLNALARAFPHLWALGVTARGRIVHREVTDESVASKAFHFDLWRGGTPHYYASQRPFLDLIQGKLGTLPKA